MNKEIKMLYKIFFKNKLMNLTEKFYIHNCGKMHMSSGYILKYARDNGIEIRLKLC